LLLVFLTGGDASLVELGAPHVMGGIYFGPSRRCRIVPTSRNEVKVKAA